jgi:uncharacterized protein with HEPN domain
MIEAGQRHSGWCPDVPSAQPARLRNRIVHGYWSIDVGILHTTATALLPGSLKC